nr:p-aminobenzoyl-glutamate transport protein-like [Nerophis lumbriciformis]
MADATTKAGKGWLNKALNWIEVAGNKLPDPAVLFLILMIAVWLVSAFLAPVQFGEIHPQTDQPIQVVNQLSPQALSTFMVDMVKTFTGFHPLGVVLVALLGVGVAEHTGFINACLKGMLSFTPKMLLTPMLVLVSIVSHTAADSRLCAGHTPRRGDLLRPPDAIHWPTGVDIVTNTHPVNPACNWFFTSASSVLVILICWFITDRVIEPRLQGTKVDGDPDQMPKMEVLTAAERKGMPETSVLRSPTTGSLTDFNASLMQMIVPLIFLLFILPGVVHGYVAKSIKGHRDVVEGMSKAMATMGYYLVMAFFASLFIYSFTKSNIGILVAMKGANFLQSLDAPAQVTIVGIILLAALVNLLVGSASAKWALLAPIFVPMLMQIGLSPELTQAAYRVGDSTTNIITPLMPYFPLVVVFCQRYVKKTGIGTVVSLMLPYSVTLLITWTIFLLIYWGLGIPLGLQASYVYPESRSARLKSPPGRSIAFQRRGAQGPEMGAKGRSGRERPSNRTRGQGSQACS